MDPDGGPLLGEATLVGNCLYGAPVAEWLQAEIGEERGADFPCDSAIGIVRDGKICGAVGFSNYRPKDFDITIHAAFRPGTFSREAAIHAMRYAFEQLGCKRITAVTTSSNELGQKLIELYGFTREGTMKKAFRGEHDLLVYRLTKRLWRRTNIDKGVDYDAKQVIYVAQGERLEVLTNG